jgi:hypothetical protein
MIIAKLAFTINTTRRSNEKTAVNNKYYALGGCLVPYIKPKNLDLVIHYIAGKAMDNYKNMRVCNTIAIKSFAG